MDVGKFRTTGISWMGYSSYISCEVLFLSPVTGKGEHSGHSGRPKLLNIIGKESNGKEREREKDQRKEGQRCQRKEGQRERDQEKELLEVERD